MRKTRDLLLAGTLIPSLIGTTPGLALSSSSAAPWIMAQAAPGEDPRKPHPGAPGNAPHPQAAPPAGPRPQAPPAPPAPRPQAAPPAPRPQPAAPPPQARPAPPPPPAAKAPPPPVQHAAPPPPKPAAPPAPRPAAAPPPAQPKPTAVAPPTMKPSPVAPPAPRPAPAAPQATPRAVAPATPAAGASPSPTAPVRPGPSTPAQPPRPAPAPNAPAPSQPVRPIGQTAPTPPPAPAQPVRPTVAPGAPPQPAGAAPSQPRPPGQPLPPAAAGTPGQPLRPGIAPGTPPQPAGAAPPQTRPPGQPLPPAAAGTPGQPPRPGVAPGPATPPPAANAAPGVPGQPRPGAGQPGAAPPITPPQQGAPNQPQARQGNGGNGAAIATGAAVGFVGGFLASQALTHLQDVQSQRQEYDNDGARVYQEPGRTIIEDPSNRYFIAHDENERFRDLGYDVRSERRGDQYVASYAAPDGSQVTSFTDDNGRLLRRIRRFPDGREIVLIDNGPPGPPRPIDEDVIVLPPPPLTIPEDRYFVDADRVDQSVIYDTLVAPPVAPITRRYTLDQVRYSPDLRARMRSVDINAITFDTGSWTVAPAQSGRLSSIAAAINQAIGQNPKEIFLVEGFTDAVGSPVDNLSLSDRRAQSVATILTQQFQVPPENLTTQGYGSQFLRVQTQAAEVANRRVVVQRITPLLEGNAK